MKKVYLMLLCAATIAFVGCNKDSEPTPQQEQEQEQEQDPEEPTGLALVKKVFEQVKADDALATMRRSVYDSVSMESFDQFYKVYTYKSAEDSIILYLLNDSVQEADVFYVYENNVIGTTCLQRLENEWGSSVTVRGLMLDSTYAYIKSDKPQDLGGYISPISVYRLYKYQEIVDSIKSDTKMYECSITYSSRKGTVTNVTPQGIFWCIYDSVSNTTKLQMGYYVPTAS